MITVSFDNVLRNYCVVSVVYFVHCCAQVHAKNETFIDRNSIGVTFSSDIDHVTDGSKKDLQVTMLQIVSDRFSHVILETGDEDPTAAAQVNKRLHNTSVPLLNIKLSISFEKTSKLSSVLSKTNSSLEKAFEANLIYPNTVTTLILNVDDIDEEESENISTQLFSYIRNHTLFQQLQLQLAIWLPIEDCGSHTSIPEYTLRILGQTDLIIFHNVLTTRQVASGAQKNVQTVTTIFSSCEKRIRRILKQRQLEILWSTKTSSSGEQGYSIEYFIEYWKLVSEWATENKQFIFFFEAFDTLISDDDSNSKAYRGWWRLANEVSVHVTKSSFVEKLLDFQHLQEVTTDQSTSNSAEEPVSVTTIVLIALFVGSLLILLLAGAVFLLYKKVKNIQTPPHLSETDYDEFMKGDNVNPEAGGACYEMLRLPYDKQKYELGRNSFKIDFSALLGTGTFGSVYRGSVYGLEKAVAFKLTQPSCPIPTLKGLLSEIKLLSYLGKHENIVGLVGAYTVELRTGLVYVVTELCEAGSLEKYLRAQQLKERTSVNYLNVSGKSGESELDNSHNTPEFQWERDMLRWSLEIASGLEYIGSKHVVHADIAARNILLTTDLTAKIADFGLSRRMYDYTNYVKKQQEPLPWRWMSIESLRNMEFSEMSDIWAFGITMWEIYSLGDTPYPGLSWNLEFVGELQKGLRLQCPQYASQEIYDLMLECWQPNPGDRIPVSTLKKALTTIFSKDYQVEA